jgi:hypothetical protein
VTLGESPSSPSIPLRNERFPDAQP